MYSAYKLNKQNDNIQPCHTTFPVLNQSIVPCSVLIVASWLAYGFLRKQVKWSSTPISWRIFHSFLGSNIVKGFSVDNEAEVNAFLEFPCFLHDPMNGDNLISSSSASANSSLYIWKFSVHLLLKPNLKDFEHNLPSMWNKCNCIVVWPFFSIALLWGMKTPLFQSCGHCWVFQICWHIECSTLTASSFRIWNSSLKLHHLH